jgi:hypothetical protein
MTTVHRLVAVAFIANPDDKTCIDHIDNSRINNDISNLRWATHTENSQNASISSNNSSGVKGVYFNKKANKWQAYIQIDGIKIHLGLYDTIEEATQAIINKVNQAFGQYKNACEGVNNGAKLMKIWKPKKIVKPNVVKPDVKTDVR